MKHLDDDELDALLAKELRHDPGEEYFASFADRVAARIAAETPAPEPLAPPVKRGGVGAWFGALFTPRGLAYAGGTLALLVVAGLVYNSTQHGPVPPSDVFGNEATIPSEPTPASDQMGSPNEPSPSQGEQESPAAGSASAEQAPDAAAKASPAPRQAPSARMYEVRPGANGEEVPVKPRAVLPRPALAPIPGESEQARAKRELNAQPMRTQALGETKTQSAETAQPSSAPAPSIAAERRGGMQPARDEDVGTAKELSVTNRLDSTGQLCGAVRDASGRAVAGARVTLTGDGSGATTDSRGAFCLPRPRQAGTLSVLAVGFRESRLTVGPSSSQALAVTLDAVDPLAKVPVREMERYPGPSIADSDLGFRGTRTGPVTQQLDGKVRADAYARESAPARASVAFAREAQKAAEKTPTTEGWTVAGERWSLVASLVRGEAAVPDARFQAARARYASWELGPDERRKRHAREAVDAFLAIAANGPLRDLALGWKAKLAR